MFKKYSLFLFVPFFFFADQFSKRLITSHFSENQSLPVISGVFHLTRVNNTGAAFGLFRGAGIFLIVVTLASIMAIVVYILGKWSQIQPSQRWGWILVISGALGNLYDRLFYHYVIDFLDFRVWPVFNLADSFVCIGVFLVAMGVLRK